MEQQKIEKVIFVCTGNTCRSPMAECLYRNVGMDGIVEVQSRGMVVHFPEPINPKAEIVLRNHEMELSGHVSLPFKISEMNEGTLILTMTEGQKRNIQENFSLPDRVFALKEYAGEAGDVLDPYGGSVVDYEECFGEIARLVRKAAYRIARENDNNYRKDQGEIK